MATARRSIAPSNKHVYEGNEINATQHSASDGPDWLVRDDAGENDDCRHDQEGHGNAKAIGETKAFAINLVLEAQAFQRLLVLDLLLPTTNQTFCNAGYEPLVPFEFRC